MGEADEPVRVLISYAHQDSDHQEAVRRLWTLLRVHGIDARLDLSAAAQREFWPAWMSEQLRAARYVLLVASAAYRERGEGRGETSVGRGVRWESRQLMERWYADEKAGLRSILPVVLPGSDPTELPDWMLPSGATVYHVEEFTLAGAEALLRVLTDQPLDVEPPLGRVPALPARPAADLTPPAFVSRSGLRTELVVDARVVDQTLTCEVTLAEAPLCRREAVLPPELTNVWSALSAGPKAAQERLLAAGRALTRAVFDEAGQRLVADLVAGLRPQDELAVVWRASGPALAVPVEALRLTSSGGEELGPLALIGGVSVRRQLGDTGPRPETTGLPGPLRVLAAVAAPEESRTANTPLDVEAEMQALLDAVGELAAGANGQVRILEVASLSQITAALRSSDYHVLHLSAHGSPSSVELEDEDGNPQQVRCRDLINAIRDAKAAVPLIVLSSCAGAAGGGEAIAAGLIDAGADRVVAMQATVSDRYATQLLAQFYRELATGPGRHPAGALARARRAVERARRSTDETPLPEYAVATLLCAGADRPLIEAARPPVPLPANAMPSGTSVRELGIGQLIGRRTQLREGTAALRRTESARDRHGTISGVQLIGVGGIGKTAVAGRLATRVRGDGMLPVVHDGRWNPSALFAALAATLDAVRPGDAAAAVLVAADLPDTAKVGLVGQLLATVPVLLVFDDFEQNLTPGGGQFLDPAFDEVFTGWCDGADVGAILVTCRYPLPGDDRYLVSIPVGPLSPAELRRLLLRLPALRGLTGEDLRLLIRTIGGHPRLIEYVDALLRGRPTRLRQVQNKLRDLARREGIDLKRPRPVGAAVEDALLLGGADILLDELLDLLTDHEREVLRQLSVSRAPMTLDDLAQAMADATLADQLAAETERLADLTLLAPGDTILVHPWTAELLDRRPDPDRSRRHEQALRMRLNRLENGRMAYEDLIDIPRHLAALGRFNEITGLATEVAAALPGVLAASAYLAEIRPLIPSTERAWYYIAKREYEAIRAAGELRSARGLLEQMKENIDQRIAADPLSDHNLADLSVLLVDLGDLATDIGDLDTARRHFESALQTFPADEASIRSNSWWQKRPAVIRDRLGKIASAAGDLSGAREHFETASAIVQRLVADDPANTEWQRDLSVSHNRLGEVARLVGDGASAREHFEAARAIRQQLVAADPANAEWRRGLSVSHDRLGDVAMTVGDLADAREHYAAALAIRQQLVAADPANAEWQRDLSISRNRLGEVAVAVGDLAAAREHFEAALVVAQRLVAADPANAEWQRDLAISRNRLGDVAVAVGDLVSAREHFEDGAAIVQRWVAADPTNAEWQRDLSISRNKLGGVARLVGDLAAAREHFEAGLVVAQRLVAADPANAEWQRDLSVSYNRVGEMARLAGEVTAAREHFEASRVIAQRLASADPANAEWQRDLSISRNKLGDVAVEEGDLAGAKEHFEAGLVIAQRLASADPANAEWQRDLSISRDRLGDVAVEEGDLAAAKEHFEAGLAIAQRLAAADPANVQWQRDLAISHERLGEVAQSVGDPAAAREHLTTALAIRQQLVDGSGNVDSQRHLGALIRKIERLDSGAEQTEAEQAGAE
ncbi:CHAT domain-containing protein [Micromonospora zingiberis]|uniref:CHAT domain-containing protein n=1 Tax=Micromonospora zingiberis TaxID=2053011 RepID=A0A4R0GUK7_9ACTN|nr:CHAT domain-containing protein [Micromonospora zingiberis]TCC00364.1 CHAT domain-containing protein [Micromonospora zingiberis]